MKSPVPALDVTVFVSPTFSAPPLVETALSIQFSGLNWSALAFGPYYQSIKNRFPGASEEPSLPPIIETFPTTIFDPKQLVLIQGIQPSRWLFSDELNSSLLQVQADRFGFNWRKVEDESYPRYDVNCEVFHDEFRGFREFCEKEQIGNPQPQFCEVVYVNHITPHTGEELIDLFERTFKGVEFATPKPELATFNRTYVIGNKEGRLYAQASILPNDKITFKLTSRVRCTSESWQSSLDQAHRVLIERFAELTESEMHNQRWGLEQ